jgi:Kdo2-lipid IVA lauroyltransferase/acyltransferase
MTDIGYQEIKPTAACTKYKSIFIMRFFIFLMPVLAYLPLCIFRGIGYFFGILGYLLLKSRRNIARTNIRLCFPHWSKAQQQRVVRQVFIRYGQSLLDRIWIWHGPHWLLKKRFVCHGDWSQMEAQKNTQSTIIFLPHFFGLDAGAACLALFHPARNYCTIYTNQSSSSVTKWMAKGRARFTSALQFTRGSGVREIVHELRRGGVLVLLPDMNFDPRESIFVPFYGVTACTVPSLSRFARLGRANVIPLLPKMTKNGYSVEMKAAWQNFPSDDHISDTHRMNMELEAYIDTMPEQYFWVHRRFKDQPNGASSIYSVRT